MPSMTTPSGTTVPASSPTIQDHHASPITALSIVAPGLAVPAPPAAPDADEEHPFSSAPRTLEELRGQLADLALQNELLLSWWNEHGDKIRAADDLAASRVHDCFVDAVCVSRSLARQAGVAVDRDYLKNYDWHPEAATPPAPEVGPAPALRYTGGTLGLGDAVPEIMVEAPDGLYQLSLEQALRNIDRFAEPGRTRLLLGAGIHYDIDLTVRA